MLAIVSGVVPPPVVNELEVAVAVHAAVSRALSSVIVTAPSWAEIEVPGPPLPRLAVAGTEAESAPLVTSNVVVVPPDDAASAGTAADNEMRANSDAIAALGNERAFDTNTSLRRTVLRLEHSTSCPPVTDSMQSFVCRVWYVKNIGAAARLYAVLLFSEVRPDSGQGALKLAITAMAATARLQRSIAVLTCYGIRVIVLCGAVQTGRRSAIHEWLTSVCIGIRVEDAGALPWKLPGWFAARTFARGFARAPPCPR